MVQQCALPVGVSRREPHRDSQRATPALTSTAWQPQRRMSFEDWVDQGRKLGLMGRSAGWWIGDWLRYGNEAYGERYPRAARMTGYDVQTLMNMVYVTSRIEAERRRESLSWSHHAEVAALSREEQDGWLELAERERLSVRCLRQEMRRERRVRHRVEQRARAADGHEHVDGEDAHVVWCPACGHTFRTEEEQSTVAAGR